MSALDQVMARLVLAQNKK